MNPLNPNQLLAGAMLPQHNSQQTQSPYGTGIGFNPNWNQPGQSSQQNVAGPQLDAAGFAIPGTGQGSELNWANDEINRAMNAPFSGSGAAFGMASAAAGQAQEADRLARQNSNATFDADLQRRMDEIYAQSERRLNPEWEGRRRQFDQMLMSRGIDPASPAGQRAAADFERERADAFSAARNEATQFGAGLQNQRFQQQLAQQQLDDQRYANIAAGAAAGGGFNPQALQMQRDAEDRRRWQAEFDEGRSRFDRGFDFNQGNADFDQLMALMGFDRGSVGFNNQMQQQENAGMLPWLNMFMPQGGPQGIDVMGPMGMQYQGQMQGFQNNQNRQNANNQMLGQALQLLPMIFSDRRVKRDITRIGTADNGLPIYTFRYTGALDDGRIHVGVMAQDVEAVNPSAVAEFGGIKAVNYAEAFRVPSPGL